tara:strand:+ start:1326 stop:1670 length:345 start_codon:yes stop_codon:yes gene_type:complete
MKKVSDKQKKINKELKAVYKQMAIDKPHYCTGCGRGDLPLSHSHLIPRSRSRALVTDPRNITYHCLGGGDTLRKGCHQIWEGTLSDKKSLLDYHANMEYILEADTEYYFILTEL